MPLVFAYARVSGARQAEEGISLEEQQRRIDGQAMAEGWTITERFIEAGVSGSVPLGERPEGARLLATVQRGDTVIAAKLDRVFRSARDALNVIEDFSRRGVSLWLLDIGGDVSGNGIAKLMLTILSAFAEFERDRIGERIRDAKQHMRGQGRHLGGKRPFGWAVGPREEGDKTAPMLITIPEEQEAIREMLKMRDEGATLRAIATTMRTRGFPLSPETVRQVLVRTADDR